MAQGVWDTLTSSTPSPPNQDSERLSGRLVSLSRLAMRNRKGTEGNSGGEGRKRERVARKRPHGMLGNCSFFRLCRQALPRRAAGLFNYSSQNSQCTVSRSFPLLLARPSVVFQRVTQQDYISQKAQQGRVRVQRNNEICPLGSLRIRNVQVNGCISGPNGDNLRQREGTLEPTEAKVWRGRTEVPGGRKEEPEAKAEKGRGGGGKSKPEGSAAASSSF